MYKVTCESESVEGTRYTIGRCYIYRNGKCVGQAVGASRAHAMRRAHADVRRIRKENWR